jgi:hypothetical protein
MLVVKSTSSSATPIEGGEGTSIIHIVGNNVLTSRHAYYSIRNVNGARSSRVKSTLLLIVIDESGYFQHCSQLARRLIQHANKKTRTDRYRNETALDISFVDRKNPCDFTFAIIETNDIRICT